jgi:hypothetical protein
MMGSSAFSGSFVVSDLTFDDQRWFQLDLLRVVTTPRSAIHRCIAAADRSEFCGSWGSH